MITHAFSVHDKAVGAFLPPFFCRSKAEAIRSFMEAVGDKEHHFAKHPHDFMLLHIGQFDDSSGLLDPLPKGPERVISAIECFPEALEGSAVRPSGPRAVM